MDSDFRIDIGEVHRAIALGEIIALYFPLLRKTLLMDTRTTPLDGPMIKVVPMASSAEERFRELGRMRPRLPRRRRGGWRGRRRGVSGTITRPTERGPSAEGPVAVILRGAGWSATGRAARLS